MGKCMITGQDQVLLVVLCQQCSGEAGDNTNGEDTNDVALHSIVSVKSTSGIGCRGADRYRQA